jgi:adenylylsulfate kinase-like enzyme
VLGMTDRSDARAVLITGSYGAGKTSAIEELAEIFEERGTRYGAIDLDWLAWLDPGSPDHAAAEPTMLKNLDAVAANYYETGVRTFALAGTVHHADEIERIQQALAMPMATVRLEVPMDVIERRLSTSVTSGRQVDLSMAREWLARGTAEQIGDFVIRNDGPVRDVAFEILDVLAW